MNENDIFTIWWVRLGLAGVFGVFLVYIFWWVWKKNAESQTKLDAKLDARELEDRKQREVRDKRDTEEKQGLIKDIQELRKDRIVDLQHQTAVVVKALTDCTLAQHDNARARDRLDTTLKLMVTTLNNMPCNASVKDVNLRTPHPFIVAPPPQSSPGDKS